MKNINYNIDLDEFKINTNSNIDKPVSICIHVSNSCNLKCAYCLSSSDKNKKRLALNNINDLIDILTRYFPLRIVISGGEPLLYENIVELISKLKSSNNIVILSTNATIDITLYPELLELVDWFDISLHGVTAEDYRKTRNSDAFQTVVKNIKILTEHKIRVCLNYLIHKENLYSLDSFFEVAKNLRINKVRLANLIQEGSALETDLLPISTIEEFEYISNISEKYENDFKKIVLPAFKKQKVVKNGYFVIEPFDDLKSNKFIRSFYSNIETNLKNHYILFNGYEKY